MKSKIHNVNIQINKTELNKILNGEIGYVNIIKMMKTQNSIQKNKQPTLRELVMRLIADVSDIKSIVKQHSKDISNIKNILKRNNLK
ncbi:MAG: hypothetical protein LBV53_02845 [Mycoplasmataceae bacterium]|jgi:RNA processing factor Prp31|nr:hypothetical protein [Mycoplasmataceae bacterium]